MSKGKSKQVPLPNPTAGSANPAVSLSALWGYIEPALDHIIRSQTNDPTQAPSIDVGYHMGIHTATYNYFTSQSENANHITQYTLGDRTFTSVTSGADLYEQLDKYFVEAARELFLGIPQDDSTLIHYIIPCFNRYSAGAHAANRLLNYVNRHYVKRAVDEDKGWLRFNDVLESVAKTITIDDTREKISKRFREKRGEELQKWGYVDGASPDLLARAEACAEAASPPDRVVPVSSLALRRFRTEVIDPLLATANPKGKTKVKNKINQPSKGRLSRAVKELMEATEGDEEERARLATELAIALRSVGVRADHPLRKRLDKFMTILA